MSNSRVVCNEDTRIAHGLHKHKCKCGCVWFHDIDEFDMQFLGRAKYREAHCCPSCGKENREKFFHNDEERKYSHAATCALHEVAAIMDMISDFVENNSIEIQSNHS